MINSLERQQQLQDFSNISFAGTLLIFKIFLENNFRFKALYNKVNVKRIVLKKVFTIFFINKRCTLESGLKISHYLKYLTRTNILNASDYGASQQRLQISTYIEIGSWFIAVKFPVNLGLSILNEAREPGHGSLSDIVKFAEFLHLSKISWDIVFMLFLVNKDITLI